MLSKFNDNRYNMWNMVLHVKAPKNRRTQYSKTVFLPIGGGRNKEPRISIQNAGLKRKSITSTKSDDLEAQSDWNSI